MKSRSYTGKKDQYEEKFVLDVIEVIHFYTTSAIHPISAIYQTVDNIEPGSIKTNFTKSGNKKKKNHQKAKEKKIQIINNSIFLRKALAEKA